MLITKFSIVHHLGVMVFCVGLVIIGAYSYFAMPRESFPDIHVPVINVITVLDGANPSDVEISVTIPLEMAIDGTEGVKKISSTSQEGLSVVSVEFYPEIETRVAKQRMRDAVDEARKDLPDEVDEPTIKEVAFSDIPILIYNLVGDEGISRSELEKLAETFEDRIKQVRGVLDVRIIGGREREVVIEIDPERLHSYNLNLSQVIQVLRYSNRNVSAGAAVWGDSRIIVRIPGEYRSTADILQLVIGKGEDGAPINLVDLAVPRYDFEDELTRARSYDFLAEDGKQSRNAYTDPRKSVSLQITKRSGDNILRISQEVAKIMEPQNLPPSVKAIKSLDQSQDVKMMVSDLENGIGTSLVLVLLVIFIGLGFSNAVLVSMAVPFSMLLSIIILRLRGETMNMMVLFSLILSLGMLVDNAIVIVENIYRHHCLGKSKIQAAVVGTQEVAWPVITSTATTLGAFTPLLFWPGVTGEFMSYLPMTVIIVLASSLFVALVINPTLCSMFMRKKETDNFVDPEHVKPHYPAVLKYETMLNYMLDRPTWTLSTAGLMLVMVLTAFACFGAGMEFFPPVDPKTISIDIDAPEGASLEQADSLCRAAEERIFGKPGSGYDQPVQNLKSATVNMSLTSGGNSSPMGAAGPINIQIEFVDREYRTESTVDTLQKVRYRLEGKNDEGVAITTPLYEADYNVIRPQEGPPTGHPVSVEIYGEDLHQMAQVAADMKAIMRETPGTVKPTDDASVAAPTMEWEVDLGAAGMVGLDRGTVADFLRMGVGGDASSTYGHGDDEQDIRFRFPEEIRQSSTSLYSLYIPTLEGGSVPLGSIAQAKLVPGPVSIRHLDRRRVVRAGAEVQPGIRADASIRKAFQAKVEEYDFAPGISHQFGGAAEEEEEAKAFLGKAFVVAIFIIIIILVLQFNSFGMMGIVMVSVVLSLIGVFAGLVVTHLPFGVIMSGIAVISLAGVVVNNAIVLLDAIEQFWEGGMHPREAVITAATIRFRPVVLTAITTMLGLLPMAIKLNIDFRSIVTLNLLHVLQYDTESSQWWQGMAVSIIFGLMVATVLTLGIVPTLALLYVRVKERKGERCHDVIMNGSLK